MAATDQNGDAVKSPLPARIANRQEEGDIFVAGIRRILP